LYDLKPELVIDNGFLEQLHEMISDSNPMVRTKVSFWNQSKPVSFFLKIRSLPIQSQL
jgi:hypothetical protein